MAAGFYLQIALHRWSDGRLLFDALLPAVCVCALLAGPRYGAATALVLVASVLPHVLTGGMSGLPVPPTGALFLLFALFALGSAGVCVAAARLDAPSAPETDAPPLDPRDLPLLFGVQEKLAVITTPDEAARLLLHTLAPDLADCAAIRFIDDGGLRQTHLNAHPSSAPAASAHHPLHPENSPITRRALESGLPVLASRAPDLAPGLVSHLAVPIRAGERTFGVLELATTTPGRVLSQRQLLLLGRIADIVGIILHHARQRQHLQTALDLERETNQQFERREQEYRSISNANHAAASALQRTEAELKLITEAMPVLVCYITRDRRFGLANHAYAHLFDLTPESLRGRLLDDVLDKDIMEQILPHLAEALAGRSVRFDCRLPDKHGPARWLDVSYTPHIDEHGEALGCIALLQDITDRKRYEQERNDSLARYHFLASAMPQIVWTAGPDGACDYINEKWTEFTGLTVAESLVDQHWIQALHPDDIPDTRDTWKEALANGRPYDCQHRIKGADGNYRWFLSRALPRRDKNGAIVQWVGCATDIDDQRIAYAEIAAARERLHRHAEELESSVEERTRSLHEVNSELEAFTYATSHALRAPAQFIVGYTNAIVADTENVFSKESADYVQRINRIAVRMERIIQELLAYSRMSRSEIKLADLSLNVVIGDVLTYHQAEIQQSRAMIVVDSPLALVHADPTGLFQVFSNLITNAMKFTRHGTQPIVQLSAEDHGDHVRVWVEDEGIGIKPAHQERIFNLFERLHTTNEYPGTGIGLSLVRKAVARMGGSCGVESTPGKGSRFWVDLQPAHDAVLPQDARRENSVSA